MKFATTISVIAAARSAAAFAGFSTTSFSGKPSLATGYRESFVNYENENSRGPHGSSNTENVFSVLAKTEKWISQTLESAETNSGNPYSRKEVNYVAEIAADSPMIAANIFKRLREAREMGELHGASEEDHMQEKGMFAE
jgi:hypothetical protein